MDHGTRDITMARVEASHAMTEVHNIKPTPRKKGPVKTPPDKPQPLPDQRS